MSRRPLIIAVCATVIALAGCGGDTAANTKKGPEPSPAQKRAKADADAVRYKGEQMVEFDVNAPAPSIERVSRSVCGVDGFDIAVASTAEYSDLYRERILVTCRGPQQR